MWFSRTVDGFIAWFSLKTGAGNIRTGAVAANFTVTVVNPADTASTVPTVSQSAQKPGLYKFTVPAAFLVANGTGEYGVVVQVNVPGPGPVTDVFSDVLTVSQQDWDSLSAAILASTVDGAVDVQTALQRVNSWVAGKIEIQGAAEDEIVYFADDGTTPIVRNKKEDEQRTPLAP